MTENDNQQFNEEFDRIDAIRSASEDLREQRTFDIAVGGLTVPIGIFTYLVTHAEKIPSRWMIIAISVFRAGGCAELLFPYPFHKEYGEDLEADQCA